MTHDDILSIDPVISGDDKNSDTKESDGTSPESASTAEKGEDSKEKLILVKQSLEKVQKDLDKAFKILEGADTDFAHHSDYKKEASKIGRIAEDGEAKIIEGIFDGQNMIGPDGKQYSVPANYASKSKLIEGDILKLTIQPNGTFVYKQIGPRDRDRLKGILVKDEESGEFRVLADGRKYKVLLASITYFKGQEGDEVAILVPKEKNSTWAAVENVIKNIQTQDIPKTDSLVEDIGI